MSESRPVWTPQSVFRKREFDSGTADTARLHLVRLLQELDDELAELAERQEGARRLLAVALNRLRISLE